MAASQFYFGSSKGSQDKDTTIAAQSASLAMSTPVVPAQPAGDNALPPTPPLSPPAA